MTDNAKQHRSIDLDGDGKVDVEYPPPPLGAVLPSEEEIQRLAVLYEKKPHDVRYCCARIPYTGDNAVFPNFATGDHIIDLGPIMGCTVSVELLKRFDSLEMKHSYAGTHLEYAWVTLRFNSVKEDDNNPYFHSVHMTKVDATKFRKDLSVHIAQAMKTLHTTTSDPNDLWRPGDDNNPRYLQGLSQRRSARHGTTHGGNDAS